MKVSKYLQVSQYVPTHPEAQKQPLNDPSEFVTQVPPFLHVVDEHPLVAVQLFGLKSFGPHIQTYPFGKPVVSKH